MVEHVSKPYDKEVNDDILTMSGGLVVAGENSPGMLSLNCLDIKML